MKTVARKVSVWLAAVGVLGMAGVARAGGVDPRYVPGDAKWVLHVDVDAVTKGKLWSVMMVNLNLSPEHRQLNVGVGPASAALPKQAEKVRLMAEALGMRLPEDLHGITLIGRSFDETGAVLVVKGKFDKDRLIGMAKLNPGYSSATYAGVEVSSMKTGEQLEVAGAFLGDDVVVLGRTEGDVRQAIDASREAKGVASELLAGGEGVEGAGVMVYVAAAGLAELQRKAELSPILAPVTGVRASIGESGEDVVLKAVLSLKTDEAARQVRGALEGVRAMVTLATLEEHAEPTLKAVAEVSRRAVSAAQGTTVTIDWPVAVSTIQRIAEEQQSRGGGRAATRRAATEPVKSDVER